MNAIRIRYVRLSELPLGGDSLARWLSADERATYSAMRSPERRATWLAGRILAKRLLKECAGAAGDSLAARHADELHIESRSMNPGHGERPTLSIDGLSQSCAISIAHSARGVLAAVGLDATLSLGVDLAERTDAQQALQWTFTAGERAWLARGSQNSDRPEQLWALKEALYKACQGGEGFAPQKIEVVPGQLPSYPNLDLTKNLHNLQSWRVDGHLAALAVVKAQLAVETTMESPGALGRAA
jgi:4'-phosphopantetheinyl transferase EntD